MNAQFKGFLAQKGILVSERGGDSQFDVIYGLAKKFGIRITKNPDLAEPGMLHFAADAIGEWAPESFYTGFPDTVRLLSLEQRLYDQRFHYTKTYGLGDFSGDGARSVFEPDYNRSLFEEDFEPKDFEILPENEAIDKLQEYVDGVLKSTRPVNQELIELTADAVKEYGFFVPNVASSANAIKLLMASGDLQYARFFTLQDTYKLVVNMCGYDRIHLTNQQRKLVTKILNMKLVESNKDQVVDCFEKKEWWKRLLHCIHYKPVTDAGNGFARTVRESRNPSRSSLFEFCMASSPVDAAEYLVEEKGQAALLRRLNYVLSRCDANEAERVCGLLTSVSPLLLIQIMDQYKNYTTNPRIFKFERKGKMVNHKETGEEAFRRKSLVPEEIRNIAIRKLSAMLCDALKGRAGKVYIEPGMEKIAVPMQLAASQSGYGVLPTGSRIPLPKGKIIRGFTYWEKVNDIDLSVLGITDTDVHEFSWRTMYRINSDVITFSGDVTDGYNGGSEYFDIDLDAFQRWYPNVKYLVMCNNVFSSSTFKNCVCRAGWMTRDRISSGEIFEPKTVATSYAVDADATFAYLCAIDLAAKEIVWLNLADSRDCHISGTTSSAWLNSYFHKTEEMNLAKLFRMCGEEVFDPHDADLVIGTRAPKDKALIRPCDFEKVLAYLN